MNIPDLNNKIGIYQTEKYIKNNFPEFYNHIIENYPNDLTWAEKLYWYKNNITDYPVCGVCGKRLLYRRSLTSYPKYCSQKCCGKSEEAKQLRIETSIKKYGVPYYHNDEKTRQTCLERYGVENISQSKEIIEKKKQTCLERYGVTCNLHSVEGKEQVKNTMQKKYGVNYYTYNLSNEQNKKKIKETKRDKFIKNNPNVIGFNDDGSWIVKCNDNSCNMCDEKCFHIYSGMYFDRTKNNTTLCTKQNPPHSNQSSLEKFIKDILNEYNIEYIERDRSILKDQELDIYIPSKNIAIECNGCFWHSIYNKHNNYHINKYLNCKEKNIQLLTIWEDQIKLYPEIVKSMILSKLGIYENRIYARKCEVKEVGKKYIKFLQQNHIQGKTNATIKLGLFYQDQLVGIMTFSKRSKLSGGKNDNNWELTRFCTKLYTQVIGGAAKLLNYFIKKYNPKSIVSFSSNDISNGSLYKTLGFESDEKITKSYWYVNQSTYIRYHRTSFTKSRLKELGYNVENKTEEEVMKSLPFYKFYDSGHIKWIKTF